MCGVALLKETPKSALNFVKLYCVKLAYKAIQENRVAKLQYSLQTSPCRP